jgi:Immunoglobulin I-set domain
MKYFIEHFTRVRWLDQDKIVIADSDNLQIQNFNNILHNNGSLEFFNVQINDTGDYECEITIRYRIYNQVHSIEVQGNY